MYFNFSRTIFYNVPLSWELSMSVVWEERGVWKRESTPLLLASLSGKNRKDEINDPAQIPKAGASRVMQQKHTDPITWSSINRHEPLLA